MTRREAELQRGITPTATETRGGVEQDATAVTATRVTNFEFRTRDRSGRYRASRGGENGSCASRGSKSLALNNSTKVL